LLGIFELLMIGYVTTIDQYLISGSELSMGSLRFLFACLLIYLFISSLVNPLLAAFAQAKRMHQIPCSNCRYFSGNYILKCTIRPIEANTEEAIGCLDYQLLEDL